jgi:hypothetical protein
VHMMRTSGSQAVDGGGATAPAAAERSRTPLRRRRGDGKNRRDIESGPEPPAGSETRKCCHCTLQLREAYLLRRCSVPGCGHWVHYLCSEQAKERMRQTGTQLIRDFIGDELRIASFMEEHQGETGQQGCWRAGCARNIDAFLRLPPRPPKHQGGGDGAEDRGTGGDDAPGGGEPPRGGARGGGTQAHRQYEDWRQRLGRAPW